MHGLYVIVTHSRMEGEGEGEGEGEAEAEGEIYRESWKNIRKAKGRVAFNDFFQKNQIICVMFRYNVLDIIDRTYPRDVVVINVTSLNLFQCLFHMSCPDHHQQVFFVSQVHFHAKNHL